jgi:hypothetical protein
MRLLSRFGRRGRRQTEAELREDEEARLRAKAELREAEQDAERSREQSRVPGAMRNIDPGGFGGGF